MDIFSAAGAGRGTRSLHPAEFRIPLWRAKVQNKHDDMSRVKAAPFIEMSPMTYPVFSFPLPRASSPTEADLAVLVRQAAAALAGLALITLQSHYDMAAFRLRGLLQAIEHLPADLPQADQESAVLLWRLQVFDAHCETHFLTGLPNLQAWAKRLLADDSAANLHAPQVAARFLAQQRALGGLLTNPQRDVLWQTMIVNPDRTPSPTSPSAAWHRS